MRWLALGTLLLVAACERERRRFHEPPAAAARPDARSRSFDPGPRSATGAPLTTGPAPAGAAAFRPAYDDNAWAVAEGKRLFSWFNCVGCHSHGGGGMGPPLMDDLWLYGSAPEDLYASIVEGRPRGMPSFRGRIPDLEVWQLVAYVRSLSGRTRPDVRPGRDDAMSVKSPESLTEPTWPRPSP
jgi:cytochrome c oxidase cbb3-type subunit 3